MGRRLLLIRCDLQWRRSNASELVPTCCQDISNELQNEITVVIAEPVHAPAVLARHATHKTMIRAGQANIATARQAQEVTVQALIGQPEGDPVQLAILQNQIAEALHEAGQPVPMQLADSEKTQSSNDWRTFVKREMPALPNIKARHLL